MVFTIGFWLFLLTTLGALGFYLLYPAETTGSLVFFFVSLPLVIYAVI